VADESSQQSADADAAGGAEAELRADDVAGVDLRLKADALPRDTSPQVPHCFHTRQYHKQLQQESRV
jgi:hypothetical protein